MTDNQKPDVYDIAVDTGDGTYWTAEVVHFQQNDNVRKIQVRIPQQGSQLLQHGEAVAEPFGYWHQGDTYEESEFHLHSESGDVSCEHCIKLFTTPPDTQQKLDKAREALRKIATQPEHPHVPHRYLAQQALKDTE